jgi:hypothetical protein
MVQIIVFIINLNILVLNAMDFKYVFIKDIEELVLNVVLVLKYVGIKKRKNMCKLCGGSQICFHNNYKSLYKECKGSQLCIHNKRKNNCCLCNFHLYLVNTQRKQINRCFKLSSITKNKHSIEYLGCNIDEFIKFFENKINYYNEFIATDIF